MLPDVQTQTRCIKNKLIKKVENHLFYQNESTHTEHKKYLLIFFMIFILKDYRNRKNLVKLGKILNNHNYAIITLET
jgi:hypothetical protein